MSTTCRSDEDLEVEFSDDMDAPPTEQSKPPRQMQPKPTSTKTGKTGKLGSKSKTGKRGKTPKSKGPKARGLKP